HFNPLLQGWEGATRSYAASGNPPPSVFGALPTLGAGRVDSQPPLSNATTFVIAHFRPTILNSTVVNLPGGQPAFRVITDPSNPLRTTYQDIRGRTFAYVDWGSNSRAVVEMPGLLARQSIRSWLRTSSRNTARQMEVRGMAYQWVPMDAYICLYAQNQVVARVSSRPDGVHVELSPLALQYGLLEVCILCATIFLSGRNID
ncbi:hypothetical protein FA95DRAFT_1475164, partial [Auriscalpium vulgare]